VELSKDAARAESFGFPGLKIETEGTRPEWRRPKSNRRSFGSAEVRFAQDDSLLLMLIFRTACLQETFVHCSSV